MHKQYVLAGYGFVAWAMMSLAPLGTAQTGSVHEPIRYIGGVSVDLRPHEGRLRPAVGVENRQILRVNRTHPERAEGSGWTYNHAPDMAYWNGTFYVEYLSNPVDEHIAPGQTLIATSSDGRNWAKPEVVFPPYKAPRGVRVPRGSKGYMMHQRMGFHVTPDDRLLVFAFYGHAEDPFEKGGIGRVVREAYRDGSYGPIYFIRYGSQTPWNATNTSYPFYRESGDAGFAAACDGFLANHLKTLQWRDEDRGIDGFYPKEEQLVGEDCPEAFNYYRRKDGAIVGLWKRSTSALSFDEGKTFSTPVKPLTFTMAGGKQWGQATDDGRYAILYNPTIHDEHRYPLIAVTSDDGILFDDMVLVHSEVPPRRFFGRWKDFGPCYVHGILDGNGNPPGDDLWVAYSVNKEDMWVSRVPLSVKHTVAGGVADTFDALVPGAAIPDWNVYAPLWAPVAVEDREGGRSLVLRDQDPYDYARAVRVFQEGTEATISFKVKAAELGQGMLDAEIMDRFGNRPVRLRFEHDGQIKAWNGTDYAVIAPLEQDIWYHVEVKIAQLPLGHYTLSVNGAVLVKEAPLAEAVKSVERVSFRTGPFRDLPTRQTVNETPHEPLPGADDPVEEAVFCIDDVHAEGTGNLAPMP
ncbi:MAG: hypothetical protein HYV27_09045 [Candidatus Hydrogenedentes bacterium]|nr:hypothetical protein [Candidatus Hydrogenedentota bacterium]